MYKVNLQYKNTKSRTWKKRSMIELFSTIEAAKKAIETNIENQYKSAMRQVGLVSCNSVWIDDLTAEAIIEPAMIFANGLTINYKITAV